MLLFPVSWHRDQEDILGPRVFPSPFLFQRTRWVLSRGRELGYELGDHFVRSLPLSVDLIMFMSMCL